MWKDIICPTLAICVLLCNAKHIKGARCYSKTTYLSAYYGVSLSRSFLFYQNNDQCSWKIEAPPGMVIKLKFTSFSLQWSSSCNSDYLRIYDGPSTYSSIIGKYCGDNTYPPIIISKGLTLYLRFKSDYYSTKNGFTFNYEAVSPETSSNRCTAKNSFANNNNIDLTSSSGYIYSPSYPSNYPNSMQCTWKIKVSSGRKIKLEFEYFNVMKSLFDCDDYLLIHDGYSSSSIIKGKYCGSQRHTIYSSGRYMWLRFRSDSSSNSAGFKLYYTSESDSSSSGGLIAGIVIGILVVIAAIIIIVYCCKKGSTNGTVTNNGPSTITTTTTTMATNQQQTLILQPANQAPPPYQQKGAPPPGYQGPPPQGYTGPPPQGYAGPPPQGYAGQPQAYAGPPPQGYPGAHPQSVPGTLNQGFVGPPPTGYVGPPPGSYPTGVPPPASVSPGPPPAPPGPTTVSL